MSEGRVVLVTGAAGFVGSALARCLASALEGQPATSPFDSLVLTTRNGGLTPRLSSLAAASTVSVEALDTTDPVAVSELMRRVRPRAVLHLADDVRPHREFRPEVEGTRQEAALTAMVDTLHDVGGRLVYTSSVSVLPDGPSLDENTQPDPRLPYAVAKLAGERVIAERATAIGVPWLVLRLFYLFGRGEAPHRLLPSMVAGLLAGRPVEVTKPERVRDFSDVDVVVRCYAAALVAPDEAWNAIYHVGSGAPITLAELGTIVADELGADPALVREGNAPKPDAYLTHQVADPTAARERLGWEPGGDPRPALRATTRWWRDQLESDVRPADVTPAGRGTTPPSR